MRKREKERQVRKAQKAIEVALKPYAPCCRKRIIAAVAVMLGYETTYRP